MATICPRSGNRRRSSTACWTRPRAASACSGPSGVRDTGPGDSVTSAPSRARGAEPSTPCPAVRVAPTGATTTTPAAWTLIESADEPLLIPAPVLVEVDSLIHRKSVPGRPRRAARRYRARGVRRRGIWPRPTTDGSESSATVHRCGHRLRRRVRAGRGGAARRAEARDARSPPLWDAAPATRRDAPLAARLTSPDAPSGFIRFLHCMAQCNGVVHCVSL